MLGPRVLQICVEHDFGIAVSEQPSDQQTQDFSAHTSVLTIGFADLDADFGRAGLHLAIIALADQTVTFLNDQTTLSKPFGNFGLGGPHAIGEACVCHHGAIVPPSGQLFGVGSLGLTNG